jgi:hypothetical protein
MAKDKISYQLPKVVTNAQKAEMFTVANKIIELIRNKHV